MDRRAKRRRSRIMTVLVIAALGTGAWALFGSAAAISINLTIDLVAVAYGVLLYRSSRRRSERIRQVRTISRHPLSESGSVWPAGVPSIGHDISLDDEPLFLDEPIAL